MKQERFMNTSRTKNKMRHVRHVLFIGLITVMCLTVALAGERPCEWTGIKKIIAIGDLHGDYENFVEILKGVQLVDDSLHWIGGDIHFVQTGDILDRGPEARKIFDLIRRLETEAEEAGGMVHMLIGNHEEMNITGIAIDNPRYVTVEQFVSFLPDKFREKKEENFKKEFEKKYKDSSNFALSFETELRNFWADVLKKNRRARLEYISNFNDKYGKWILKHNAVIKINDTIFVHGGINKEYSKKSLKDINTQLRRELEEFRLARKQGRNLRSQPKIVYHQNGPLWYRGLAQEDEEVFAEEVQIILNNLGAKHMVIAHTPRRGSSRVVSEEFVRRYDESIWIIDTGISELYGGFLSALIIEEGDIWLWPEGEINEK
jgi:polyhydroxyalkanoate synthesis regulator phasin